MSDFLKFDDETAEILVQDFLMRVRSAETIEQVIPRSEYKDIIGRGGFRTVSWKKKGINWPPARALIRKIVEDPELALHLGVGLDVHILVDSHPRLGPKRIERFAKEHGPLEALWISLMAAIRDEKTSPSGFKRATELVAENLDEIKIGLTEDREIAKPRATDDRADSGEKRKTSKELKKMRKKAQGLDQQLQCAEKLLEARDKQICELEDSLRTAESGQGALSTELESAKKAVNEAISDSESAVELADQRANQIVELEAKIIESDAELAAARLALEEEPPESTIHFPEDLEKIKALFTDEFRSRSQKEHLDTDELTALLSVLGSIDNLMLHEAPVLPLTDERMGERDAQDEPNKVDSTPPATESEGKLEQLDETILLELDKHNVDSRIERLESLLFPVTTPVRILLDGHNIILRNGMEEGHGREWLEALLPALAKQTGAFIMAVLDTRYGTHGVANQEANWRIVFAPANEGGADDRIIEELNVERDGPVMVVSEDNDVLNRAHASGRESGDVVIAPGDLMFRYLEALGDRQKQLAVNPG